MRKLQFVFFALLAGSILTMSCDDTKTYAEQLEDEKQAIRNFIAEQKISVISLEDFLKDTITRCPPDYPGENEYVLFNDNGVYMQIVNRGTGDTIKNRDEILVRFLEYDILKKQVTGASNYDISYLPDDFYYTVSGTTSSGSFIDGMMPTYLNYLGGGSSTTYNATAVPLGWLVPLRFVRNKAHVKLIVPSKSGHGYSKSEVLPNFYDMRKIQIR